MIELGDMVQDKISGQKGIAIGVTKWLYGCTRIVIQPQEVKDHKPVETFCVDEPQLEVVKKAVVKGVPLIPSVPLMPTKGPRNRNPAGNRDDSVAVSRA